MLCLLFTDGAAAHALVLLDTFAAERVHQRFVTAELVFHPVPVRAEACWTIKFIDREIERAVRAAQVGGHRVRVIEGGEAGGWMHGTGIKHGLRELLDLCLLSVRGMGPRKS